MAEKILGSVGPKDSKFRILVGAVLLILALTAFTGALQIVAFAAASIAFVTALVKFCPIYRVLGVCTGGAG